MTSEELNEQENAAFEKMYADLQPKINSYAVDYIEMKAEEGKSLSLLNSKFGGLPYFPSDAEYPLDEKGKPMRLLVQINFSEIPNLKPYPESGLLQIYLSADDEMFGLDFDNITLQKNWKILWFGNAEFEPRNDLGEFFTEEWEYSPLFKDEFQLEFSLKQDIPSYPSLEYYKFINPLFEGKFEDELGEKSINEGLSDGHKIGGFPYFTQSEIRDWKLDFADYKLLLQIDSDDDKIMWGDVGVANFFIKPEDLAKRDFSKVLYNWDCH